MNLYRQSSAEDLWNRHRQEKSRLCHNRVCKLQHISQVGRGTHGLRTNQHDDLLKSIATSVKRKGWKLSREPVIRVNKGKWRRKPDLVLWNGDSPTIYILDPTIVTTNRSYDANSTKREAYPLPEVYNFALEQAGRSAEGVDLKFVRGRPVLDSKGFFIASEGNPTNVWRVCQSV